MAISESNALYAAATLALALLVQDKEFGLRTALLLIVCAVICLRAYEAAIFLGPLLAAGCACRTFQSRPRGAVVAALALSALLFLAGCGFATLSILAPRDPTNYGGAIDGVFRVNRQLWLSCALAAAYAGWVLIAVRPVRLVLAVIFIAALIALMFPANWAVPALHYHSRVAGGLALCAVGAVLIAVRSSHLSQRIAMDRRSGHVRWLVLAPLAALTVSAAPDIVYSIGWKRFQNSFEKVVNENSGLLPFDAASRSLRKESLYGWGWTYPTMSILLRHAPGQAIVLNPNGGRSWQPFDPADPRNVPDLRWYTWK